MLGLTGLSAIAFTSLDLWKLNFVAIWTICRISIITIEISVIISVVAINDYVANVIVCYHIYIVVAIVPNNVQ